MKLKKKKDFYVEKIDSSKETTDGTIKEIVKKKKKIASAERKLIEKNLRKKTKTDGWWQRKLKKIDQIKSKCGELHFDLLQNFKKQPYVAHLENPAINDVVKGGKVDSLALQKFLLATDLLQDSIQENLDMIVTDGGFNNASIRRALDTKFPSVTKKPNPVEVIFKDKSKFDVQNPVVSLLIMQVVDNKKKYKKIFRALDQAPSIKDLDIEKRFRELKNFNEGHNNDDDDDDNNTG